MLAELSRREKAANIKPDPDLDVYMKVRFCRSNKINSYTKSINYADDFESCRQQLQRVKKQVLSQIILLRFQSIPMIYGTIICYGLDFT